MRFRAAEMDDRRLIEIVARAGWAGSKTTRYSKDNENQSGRTKANESKRNSSKFPNTTKYNIENPVKLDKTQ